MRSRMIPPVSPTIDRRPPVSLLNSVDLPTLGRPSITIVGRSTRSVATIDEGSGAVIYVVNVARRFELLQGARATSKIALATTMIERIRKVLGPQRADSQAAHLELGERGERLALDYLKHYEGYQIVVTNFRVPLGRGFRGQKQSGEIDIVAYDAGTLAFIEVKTRTSDELVAPERAVDLRKQRQIARASRRYRQLMKVMDEPYRYDVVTVLPDSRGDQIELIRGYFDDRVFQRSRYFRSDE